VGNAFYAKGKPLNKYAEYKVANRVQSNIINNVLNKRVCRHVIAMFDNYIVHRIQYILQKYEVYNIS